LIADSNSDNVKPNNKSHQIIITLIGVIFLSSFAVRAQTADSLSITFYDHLYNFRFQSADSTLKIIREQQPDPIVREMIDISYGWWLLISGENGKNHSTRLLDFIDAKILELETIKETSRLSQIEVLHMIMLYSYQARIHNHLDNKIQGFKSFRASNRYFEQLRPCDEISCDVYNLIAGLYYALTGYIQKDYPGVFRLTFTEEFADIDKGLELLGKCAESETDQIKTESIYFFMKLYLEVEEDAGKAMEYASYLVSKFPDNLVFRLNQLLILNENGDEDALEKACASFLDLTRNNNQLSERQRTHFTRECKELIKKCVY